MEAVYPPAVLAAEERLVRRESILNFLASVANEHVSIKDGFSDGHSGDYISLGILLSQNKRNVGNPQDFGQHAFRKDHNYRAHGISVITQRLAATEPTFSALQDLYEFESFLAEQITPLDAQTPAHHSIDLRRLSEALAGLSPLWDNQAKNYAIGCLEQSGEHVGLRDIIDHKLYAMDNPSPREVCMPYYLVAYPISRYVEISNTWVEDIAHTSGNPKEYALDNSFYKNLFDIKQSDRPTFMCLLADREQFLSDVESHLRDIPKEHGLAR